MKRIIKIFKENKKVRICILLFVLLLIYISCIKYIKYKEKSEEIITQCVERIEIANTDNEIEMILNKLNKANFRKLKRKINENIVAKIKNYEKQSEYDNEFYSSLARAIKKYNKYNLLYEKTKMEMPGYKYVLEEMKFTYGLNDVKNYFEVLSELGINDEEALNDLNVIISSHQNYYEAKKMYEDKMYSNAMIKLNEIVIYNKDYELSNKIDELKNKVCESYKKTIRKELNSLYSKEEYSSLFNLIKIYESVISDDGEQLKKEYLNKCEKRLDEKINVDNYSSAYELSEILYSVNSTIERKKWYISCLQNYVQDLVRMGKVENAKRIVERAELEHPNENMINDFKQIFNMDDWKIVYYFYLMDNRNLNYSFKIQTVSQRKTPILIMYADKYIKSYCVNDESIMAMSIIDECECYDGEYYYGMIKRQENTYYNDIDKIGRASCRERV